MGMWKVIRKSRLILSLSFVLFLASGNNVLVSDRMIEAASTAATISPISQSDYSVSEEYVVWLGQDDEGNDQIYARHLASGETRLITNRSSAKDVPSIYGTKIVWADKGEHDASDAYWDIYSYDLATQKETKLNKQSGQYAYPSIHAQGVVWTEIRAYDVMVYYDFATGQQFSLGEGKYPVLRNGQVIYKHARDGGLSVLELRTGTTRSLIQLGGNHYVDWFVASDEYVLFKQKNSMLGSKYVLAPLHDYAAQAKDLTEMSIKAEEYAFMSIGSTQAVFLENVKGVATLKGVQLADAKVYSIEQPKANSKYIGMIADQIVYLSENGELGKQEIVAVPDDNSGGTKPPTSGPGDNSSEQQETGESESSLEEQSFIIGPSGGTAAAFEGKVSLVFDAGTFTADSKVTIAALDHSKVKLLDEAGQPLQRVSDVWSITSEQAFAHAAQLTLAYPDKDSWKQQREQLGIYRYVEDHFEYVGGIVGNEAERSALIEAAIQAPGQYAVLMRHISFTDVPTSHWATHAIDVLSARGIVNGVSLTTFAPNETLTRAQFSKMLAGALGLSPQYPESPSFSDVSPHQWSYGWIEAAATAGLVEGSQGRFNPDDALTREQMMAMLVRAVEVKTASVAAELEPAQIQQYSDHESISNWSLPYVSKALQLELVQGSGNQLKPLDISSRAEAATVVYRLLGLLHLL